MTATSPLLSLKVDGLTLDEVDDPAAVGLQADGQLQEGGVVVELAAQLRQDAVWVGL